MRYVIMKNATPKGEASIRLRIAAGSLHETEAQRGLAHFTEHMAFRGTTRVPDGELFKTFERLGMRMGADTNARTGELDTVYQFDLPSIDDQTVDTGLMVTREIASEISFNPDAFQAERGPVLSEERLRDGPGMRAYVAHNGFLLKGQLAADRMPIGKVDVIQNAPVSELTDFYRAYYRPERAQVIIVGDIDPDAIEAKIRAKFCRIGLPAARDVPIPISARRSSADRKRSSSRRPERRNTRLPHGSRPMTARSTPPNGASAIASRASGSRSSTSVSRRPHRARTQPFLSASASRGNTSRSARIATLQVSYAADRWQRALIEADKIRRQVLEQGVTQQEIDRQITNAIEGARPMSPPPPRAPRAVLSAGSSA